MSGLNVKMAGQTINDRLLAARHSIAGQGLAKSVCKATTEEMIAPKKKHLDCEYSNTYYTSNRRFNKYRRSPNHLRFVAKSPKLQIDSRWSISYQYVRFEFLTYCYWTSWLYYRHHNSQLLIFDQLHLLLVLSSFGEGLKNCYSHLTHIFGIMS